MGVPLTLWLPGVSHYLLVHTQSQPFIKMFKYLYWFMDTAASVPGEQVSAVFPWMYLSLQFGWGR